MPLSDLLQPGSVLTNLRAESKKQLLEQLSLRIGQILDRPSTEIFETLFEREKLGSTGVGHGVAIPHGKLNHVSAVFGLFAKLEKPLNFEAIDDEPVDLVFVLLAPETAGAEHLKALAKVARLMRDPTIIEKLRILRDPDAIYALLTAEI